jgi:hypothetical protein
MALLASDSRVFEIARKGPVTNSIAKKGHSGIYEGWRPPDGGAAYAHKGGLTVDDREKHRVLSYQARSGKKATAANRCAVMEKGRTPCAYGLEGGAVRTADAVEGGGRHWRDSAEAFAGPQAPATAAGNALGCLFDRRAVAQVEPQGRFGTFLERAGTGTIPPLFAGHAVVGERTSAGGLQRLP